MMADYKRHFFTTLERENLQTDFTLRFFSDWSNFANKRCKTTKTHIDYILTETIADEKSFVWDTPYKTDQSFVLYLELLLLKN